MREGEGGGVIDRDAQRHGEGDVERERKNEGDLM